MDVNTNSSQPQPHVGSSSGSQIRSRVTVVCAECKRLKLKCDRRTPCSSCLKRDTVSRCTYSAAAAEKIDVQSLHNRVLVLESQLNQLTSGRMKLASSDLDHALLAVGSSGSSVMVPLDDVAGVWLEHLDLSRDSGVDLHPAFEAHETRDSTRPSSSPGSIHDSPHPSASTSATSPFSVFGHLSPPSVTPALLAFLPSAQQRPVLLEVLSSVLRMHPSLNFPHFRARINAMFSDGTSPEEIGIGPSRADHTEKPTLSFFAAAAAGFALAIQCSPNSMPPGQRSSPHIFHISSPSATPSAPSVSSLLALSVHVLDVVEDSMPYDLDFLHALVLRCLCMLHDGQPRISQAVFATVGKMVNIARFMGLARDPDEFVSGNTPRYSLWEAEMRRRMWWEVFYYDLFISDCMGFAPLIVDDQYTCRMPSDVDEDAFVPKSALLPQPAEQLGVNNFSYFVQKCKLAQLVKNMKKRIGHDASISSPSSTAVPQEPSIDIATQAESEIQQYLADLPPAFQLDVDADPTDPSYSTKSSVLLPMSVSETPSPHLIVQRCELFSIAHQLVLKIFHPFLRRANVRAPDNAMVSSINASHAIINASRIARGVWQRHGGSGISEHATIGMGVGAGANSVPSSHGIFYPFARQLFDATVMAAHIIIQAPQSVVAKVALDDMRVALDVLRDPAIATGRGRAASRGGVEGCPSEAVTIVELLLKKAEMAKRNNLTVSAGVKRKHEEMDPSVAKGFWLPYIGAGVATESMNTSAGSTAGTSANVHIPGSPKLAMSDSPHSHAGLHRVSSSSNSLRGEKRYPAAGIRHRVSTNSLADRPMSGPTRRRESGMTLQQPQPSQPEPSQPQPQPGPDSEMYASSAVSAPDPSSAIIPERVQGTTVDYSVPTPYGMEDRRVVDANPISSGTRFPSQPQTHSYPAQSFPSSGTSAPHHQPIFESPPFGSDATQRSSPSFYIPYPQPGFQTMSGHSHPHPHAHGTHTSLPLDTRTDLSHHSAMDTSDIPRVAKQEEGTDRRDAQRNPSNSTFVTPEGWATDSGATRFQTHWDPGYNY